MPDNVTTVAGATPFDFWLGNYAHADIVAGMEILRLKLDTGTHRLFHKNAAGAVIKEMADASTDSNHAEGHVLITDALGAADINALLTYDGKALGVGTSSLWPWETGNGVVQLGDNSAILDKSASLFLSNRTYFDETDDRWEDDGSANTAALLELTNGDWLFKSAIASASLGTATSFVSLLELLHTSGYAGEVVVNNDEEFVDFRAATANVATALLVDSSADAVIINEAGYASFVFRVEGDAISNLLYGDCADDRIGIGTSGPDTRLHIEHSEAGDTNNVLDILRITHGAPSPVDGFGARISFELESQTQSTLFVAGALDTIWEDENTGDSDVLINTMSAWGLAEAVRFTSAKTMMQPEIAAAGDDIAGYAQWWTKDEAPNVPMFRDDAGTDHQLAYGHGLIFTQTADVTILNDDTEQTILGAGVGTKTLPADFFTVGKTLIVKVWGVFGTTTPGGTLTIIFKLGGNAIATTGAVALGNGQAAQYWQYEGIVTCRTVGATGTIFNQGGFRHNETAPAEEFHNHQMFNAVADVIDTTGALVVDVTAEFGTAHNDNVLFSSNAIILALN